jgi:hypothetical protein
LISIEGFPNIMGPSGTQPGPGENVVEDCIIDQPAIWQALENTLINNRLNLKPNGTRVEPLSFATSRNCYINADYSTGEPSAEHSMVDEGEGLAIMAAESSSAEDLPN